MMLVLVRLSLERILWRISLRLMVDELIDLTVIRCKLSGNFDCTRSDALLTAHTLLLDTALICFSSQIT